MDDVLDAVRVHEHRLDDRRLAIGVQHTDDPAAKVEHLDMVSEKNRAVSQATVPLEAVVELLPVPVDCYVCAGTVESSRTVHIDEDGHEVLTNLCPRQHKVSTGCVVHFARGHESTLCLLPVRRHGSRVYTAVAREADCMACMLALAAEQATPPGSRGVLDTDFRRRSGPRRWSRSGASPPQAARQVDEARRL